MVLPAILAGLTLGALSEKYGLPVPNFRNVLHMNANTVAQNAWERAKEILVEEEGYRNDVYYDTANPPNLTVGIGHKVKPTDGLKFKQVISDERVAKLFAEDSKLAFDAALIQADQIGRFNVETIARLTSVNFQLGIYWRTKFPTTWGDLVSGNYKSAIKKLAGSAWAKQTPERVTAFIETIQNQFA
jgi:GH24 family phage-related lysozyme (muramidase)